MLHANSRAQHEPQAAGSRVSWSSSGDTSYYDARDHLTGDEDIDAIVNDKNAHGNANAAFDGVVETSQDLQAAHDRATAYYDNAAYHHDNNGRVHSSDRGATTKPAFSKKKNRKFAKQAKKSHLPYHLTAETNVDSATTTADESETARPAENEDETEDDFGFKYRPAIPPPRPLLQTSSPGKSAAVGLPGLTIEDTLTMKRSQAPAVPVNVANISSGILLETNIDSEMDDNSSIPSSYYPDVVVKQPSQNGLTNGSMAAHQSLPSQQQPQQQPQLQQLPAVRLAAFHFNTAVRKEDETTEVDEDAATEVPQDEAEEEKPRPPLGVRSSSGTTTEAEATWSQRSSMTAAGIREEVPRMATWSPRSPNSPSLTVIEASGPLASSGSHHKSSVATSLSLSVYSQTPPALKQHQPLSQPPPPQQQQQQPKMPPKMQARLDTDLEVSTDEADFTETTPGHMAILEYSRALEEADRMRHVAAGNYVFAQPPGSQFTNSVPEYINYTGRESDTMGSVGLRAKSMNTLTSSRNSLRSSSISAKALLPPGRARRASLRRSRLGLTVDGGGVYSIPVDDPDPVLTSGSSQTRFAAASGSLEVPEVQHHGPLRTSGVKKAGGPLDCCRWCHESCCPNAPRKKLLRWLLIGGIIACCILMAVAIAVIVVYTRPKDSASAAGGNAA